jgi:hypothetical protein
MSAVTNRADHGADKNYATMKEQRQIRAPVILSSTAFQVLLGLLMSSLIVCSCIAFILLQHPGATTFFDPEWNTSNQQKLLHLEPRLPHLPAFATIENAESLIEDTLKNNRPTIAGIVAVLNRFVSELRESNKLLTAEVAKEEEEIGGMKLKPADIRASYFSLVSEHLVPLDMALKQNSFPEIRNDGSVFMSVAAFREHMLADTLKSAFRYASNPDKLFIGAVVQNCFGNETSYSSKSCKTGWQVVDKKHDIREMLDAPPDKNGIEDFCSDEEFNKYCEAGQIRVLYVHETEALGPAVARYVAGEYTTSWMVWCHVLL